MDKTLGAAWRRPGGPFDVLYDFLLEDEGRSMAALMGGKDIADSQEVYARCC